MPENYPYGSKHCLSRYLTLQIQYIIHRYTPNTLPYTSFQKVQLDPQKSIEHSLVFLAILNRPEIPNSGPEILWASNLEEAVQQFRHLKCTTSVCVLNAPSRGTASHGTSWDVKSDCPPKKSCESKILKRSV